MCLVRERSIHAQREGFEGGVCPSGGVIADANYKTDLWRLSIKSLLSKGKYDWQECEVDGTPPAASDSMTLTCIHIPSPATPTSLSEPELPQRYFACGGPASSNPASSNDTRPKETFWGVLEIRKEAKEAAEGVVRGDGEGGQGSEYRYEWVTRERLNCQQVEWTMQRRSRSRVNMYIDPWPLDRYAIWR